MVVKTLIYFIPKIEYKLKMLDFVLPQPSNQIQFRCCHLAALKVEARMEYKVISRDFLLQSNYILQLLRWVHNELNH